MNDAWYRICHRFCAGLYYERLTVIHPERLPEDGPVLYIGLHRNGAVDGFVYHTVIPRGVFLTSIQLMRSMFMRLFFCGIGVARQKDREDSSRNAEAMEECLQLLGNGGALIVFPEGTSSLGPKHLPFKSGAAKIAVDALAKNIPLKIVPMGIHYERAWAFRSKVEVVVGEPLDTGLSEDLSEIGRLKEIKRRMNRAMEVVGANFDSEEEQTQAETLAYASTLGTDRSYFNSLKALESGVPDAVQKSWDELERGFESRSPLRHQRIALFPGKSRWLYASALLVFGVPVLVGMLLNAPPLMLAWIAAWKLADDRNVIALWRLLVGLPLFLLWALSVLVLLSLCGACWGIPVYLLITVISLETIYRTKKVGVSAWNAFRHAKQSKPSWSLHAVLDESLPP